jgi:O-antigen ligase
MNERDAQRNAPATASARRGAWIVARPEWLLLILMFVALANYGFPAPGARLRLTEVCAGLMLLVYVIRRRREIEPRGWPEAPTLALVAGGATLIAALATALGRGAGGVRFEAEALLVGLFALRWGRRISTRAFITSLSAAAAAAGLGALVLGLFDVRAIWFFSADGPFAVIGLEEGATASSGRLQLGGTFGHKNFLAAFFVLTLPALLAACLAPALDRPTRRVAAGATIVAAVVLVLGDALFGLVSTALACALVAGRRVVLTVIGDAKACALFKEVAQSVRRGGARKVVIVAALGAVFVAFGLAASGRLEVLARPLQSASIQARAYLWAEGLRLVETHPWLGIGRQSFGDLVDGGFPHAHNLYLMRFVEGGVALGVPFCVLMILCVGAAGRRLGSARSDGRTEIAAGLAAGVIGFAVYATTDYLYNEPALMALFWLWCGLALGPFENAGAAEARENA